LYYSDLKGKDGYSITYDDRSFIVAGTRTLLLSGSVHYPRSTPAMWDGLLQEMVQDGLNMVEVRSKVRYVIKRERAKDEVRHSLLVTAQSFAWLNIGVVMARVYEHHETADHR